MKRGTFEHPKLIHLSNILNISRAHAGGILEALWHFSSRYAIQGNVGKWDNKTIAIGCYWDGDENVLINALIKSKWIDEVETDDRLVIHDVKDHADNTWKQNLVDAGLTWFDGSPPRSKEKVVLKQSSRILKESSSFSPQPVSSIQYPEPVSSIQYPEPVATSVACPESKKILRFQTRGKKKFWDLEENKILQWEESYPGLDVRKECQKAWQWTEDNPTRRKTAQGMTRFLGQWLNRACNRQPARASPNNSNVLSNQKTESARSIPENAHELL